LIATELQAAAAKEGKKITAIHPEAMEKLLRHDWPGNLRELNNVIKRSTLLTSGDYVEVSALPFEITHYDKLNFEISDPPPSENPVKQQIPASTEPVKKNMPLNDYGMKHASIDAEFELIVEALKKCNYNKSKAAQMLNIDRKTLYNKMKQYKEFNGNL
jgi:two-component system response regulator HydG